ncbi:MAG: DUF4381 domain-containing protein [Halieaceae bacterium]
MNQPDPLAQLRDIHLPEPISAWPPGPAWWLLGSLLLLALIAMLWWSLRLHRANAHRRQAQRELEAAMTRWQADADAGAYARTASDILKRVALQNYPQTEVAGLSGQHWSAFLDRCWRRPPAQTFTDTDFAELGYRDNSENSDGDDIANIHRLGLAWLQQQRGRP